VREHIRTGRLAPAGTARGPALLAVAAVLLPVLLGACGSTPSPSPSPTAVQTSTSTASLTASPSTTPTETAIPSTGLPNGPVYADLDGVATSPDLAHRLPMAIMIGDNAVARPQSGFSSASIVYQSYEEAGEDRYMMVFQEGTATDIGGVRSARPYFVRWAAEYGGLYGHFGGDATALNVTIPAMSGTIYNMDGTGSGTCPYHRITTRVAPHNAYTNSAALIGCLAKAGYPVTYKALPTRPFVNDTAAADRPASQSISVPYHTVTVGYKYDPASDSYLRLLGGKLQIDPANNQQVIARDIVVMFQTVSNDPQQTGRIVVDNVGSGNAIVFKEGKAITGTWKKTTTTDLTRFFDSAGNEIPLVRGEIFIQSVPPGTAVTYK
jgi:hypothetical protein